MKRIFYLSIFIFLFKVTFANSSEGIVIVNIKNLGTQLIQFSFNEEPNGKNHYKYKMSINGKITFNAPVKELAYCQIITFKNRDHFRTKLARFYLTPNDTVRIIGELVENTIDYIAIGNKFSEEYSQLRKLMLPYLIEESELYSNMLKLKNGSRKRDSIEQIFNDLRFYTEPPIRTSFAKENLDYLIAPKYLMTSNVPLDTTIKYYNLLDKKVKASFFGKQMGNLVKINSKSIVAPNFTYETFSKDTISLQNMKGKYVVLDFWGSWCGSCINGFPKMKDYYKDFNGKIEIIGISCKDSNSSWKKAIQKHELPWINILNDETNFDIAGAYSIKVFPTKILIDPSGNICEIFNGENEEFYEYIDQIKNKNAL